MSQLKDSQHLYIPLKDIIIATNNFENCIGRGGYGRVYKGQFVISGRQITVAVKRLNENLGQGIKEFLTEIQLLSGQTHPNLVSLLGYCDEGKERIIVYECAERGSLDRYIRSGNLTWLERLKICLDAARGLEFLHNHIGKHQSIIHRDIKSANILIDQNWVAKISDLGLSKLSLAGLNRSAVISHACGTPGYCEPEYIITGIVKKESDVYSFGMVLFEVLSGRLCTVIEEKGFRLSAKFVKDCYTNNKMEEIVDPGLRDSVSSYSLKKFSATAYRCLLDDREQRPHMSVVVKELEELVTIQTFVSSYSGGPSQISAGNGPSAFAAEYSQWLEVQDKHITELRIAVTSHKSDSELHSIVETSISHFSDIFRLKRIAAKSDVLHIMYGMWKSPSEQCFLWIGGFRPSQLLKLLVSPLQPLTEQQLANIHSLHQSSLQAEEALSQGMDSLQKSMADTLASGVVQSGSSTNISQIATSLGNLDTLEQILLQADHLREQSLHQMHRILTTRQSARFVIAIYDYFSQIRALNTLSLSRSRLPSDCDFGDSEREFNPNFHGEASSGRFHQFL